MTVNQKGLPFSPSSPNRFQPARAGIISLFEYDEQEFVFEDGHLLLRGNNGSGKSKALELLLPFVLDADMRPSRLDPFGDTAKSMLEPSRRRETALFRYEQRIGCVWLEFARLADTGEMRYLTVGAHLKGVREGDVTPTYFIITGKRVGVDVLLVHQNRPITRPVLAERLADCGELFATARDYKERVNQLLYGFASYERYTNMIDLALSLRRPHLSKKLNLAELNELLADALPEVSEQLVRRTADELDQIEHFRRQLDGLSSTHAALHSLERTYAKYAEAVLSQRARELRAAQRHVTELALQARRHETALRDAEQRQLDAETAVNDLSAAVLAADDVVEELLGSPEMKTAAELDTQRVSVELDEQRAVRAAEQLTGERARLQRADTAARDAADAAQNAHGELLRAHGELERAAERAGLAERHGAVREEMGDESDGMYRLLTREADSREENVGAQRHLRGIAREAARDAEQAARRRDDAFETLRQWREKVADLTVTLEADRDMLLAAADTYLDALREISLSDEERDTVLARCSQAGPASAPDPRDPLRAAAGRARERLAEQRVSAEAQVAALGERSGPVGLRARGVTRRPRPRTGPAALPRPIRAQRRRAPGSARRAVMGARRFPRLGAR